VEVADVLWILFFGVVVGGLEVELFQETPLYVAIEVWGYKVRFRYMNLKIHVRRVCVLVVRIAYIHGSLNPLNVISRSWFAQALQNRMAVLDVGSEYVKRAWVASRAFT
jgi:hypothetical protein